MNILFRGDYRPEMYRFKCDECGTIWECGQYEVKHFFDRNEPFISCRCPVCNKLTTKAVDK